MSDLYFDYGCNEEELIVLCAEVTEASKNECIQFKNHYNALFPTMTSPEGGKAAVTACGGISSVPTVKLIAPDHSIVFSTSTSISNIENALQSAGVQKHACENLQVIKDTINPTDNLVPDAGWSASTDNEGSNVVSQPSLSGGVVSTTMHIGPYQYPDGPWTWGNLTGSVGKILDKKEYIKITYKATNDLIVEFPMEPLSSEGKNYGKRITARSEWATELLDIATFAQPVWANDNIPLDMSKIEEVVFSTFLAYDEDVDIDVKETVLYERGQTDVSPKTNDQLAINQLAISAINHNCITVFSQSGGDITVRCYTCDGRLLREVIQRNLSPGTCTLPFNPKSLSKGVYILKMQMKNIKVSEKVLISR